MQENRFFMIEKIKNEPKFAKRIRKMTKTRLQNIALYYLERFDSSIANLRQVLKRKVSDYARCDADFSRTEAEEWIDEITSHFEELGYLNDNRYAEFKIDNYLLAGKPERYIRQKMQQKGVSEDVIDQILQNREFDEAEMAKRFAAKKKIGPFRSDEESRRANRQKDLATLIRAGFKYEVSLQIIEAENLDDCL